MRRLLLVLLIASHLPLLLPRTVAKAPPCTLLLPAHPHLELTCPLQLPFPSLGRIIASSLLEDFQEIALLLLLTSTLHELAIPSFYEKKAPDQEEWIRHLAILNLLGVFDVLRTRPLYSATWRVRCRTLTPRDSNGRLEMSEVSHQSRRPHFYGHRPSSKCFFPMNWDLDNSD